MFTAWEAALAQLTQEQKDKSGELAQALTHCMIPGEVISPPQPTSPKREGNDVNQLCTGRTIDSPILVIQKLFVSSQVGWIYLLFGSKGAEGTVHSN